MDATLPLRRKEGRAALLSMAGAGRSRWETVDRPTIRLTGRIGPWPIAAAILGSEWDEDSADRRMRVHRLRRGAPPAAPHRPRRRQRRQDDLRRLGGGAGGGAPPQPRTCWCAPTSPTPRRCAQVFATHQPDAVMHLAAESHVDRSIDGPAAVRADQRRRHLHPAGGGARATAPRWTPARRAAFRFHHISTDEVFGALGPDDPPFTETTAVRSAQPLFRQQGGVRPPGAGLAPHLRAADHRQQHLQQLRPLAVPGEADPAGHAERAGGQAAAGLRRRLQPARLAVRRGPRRGAGARAGARPARRHLRDRRAPAAQQPRGGARDLRRTWTAACPTRPARASG